MGGRFLCRHRARRSRTPPRRHEAAANAARMQRTPGRTAPESTDARTASWRGVNRPRKGRCEPVGVPRDFAAVARRTRGKGRGGGRRGSCAPGRREAPRRTREGRAMTWTAKRARSTVRLASVASVSYTPGRRATPRPGERRRGRSAEPSRGVSTSAGRSGGRLREAVKGRGARGANSPRDFPSVLCSPLCSPSPCVAGRLSASLQPAFRHLRTG